VATTLLLEGDDLEALLQRAHAEGGPAARIVRAEKIRHGGVLGFFAKERFEVALEIPDRPHPTSDIGTTKGHTMSEATMSGALTTDTGPTPTRPAFATDPRAAGADGLLGLAERADAAELAVSGHPPRIPAPRSGDTSTDGADSLDLALRRLLEQRDPEPASASPVRPSTSRPEFTALLDQLQTSTATSAQPAWAVPAARPEHVVVQPAPAPVATPTAPAPAPVPAAYRDAALPAGTAGPTALPAATAAGPTQPAATSTAAAPIERHTLGRTRAGTASPATRDRREDSHLATDRRALRALGVPMAWTRQLRPGDRFTAVLRMLDRMPEVDIDPATRVVAVVGPASSVLLEAHRVALDLPVPTTTGPAPRPVVVVPAAAGAERAAALAEARLLGDVVVAIEADGDGEVPVAVEALQSAGAGAVIAIVSAADAIECSQAYLDALGQVDALAVEGTAAAAEPAAVLQLGLPVVRLDGIPIDRYTWTAVLCAQLGPVAGQ
jgi:hypothetical protein